MEYSITYEDAIRISNAYKDFNFYKTEFYIDGYRIVTFNYFLCDYSMFINPLNDDSGIHGLDMRGVTFVFNKDGSLYKRFLMLPKFFNVNQVESTQFNTIKDKKIDFVTINEDGSLIAFMQLPNGKIFAKTQGGFNNEQVIAAMQIYNENKMIRAFTNEALTVNMTPLFEYVAYNNRIVLKYSGRDLKLIGLRDNDNGEYFPATSISYLEQDYGISYVKSMNISSLDELNELMKTVEDMEGVVVQFSDGQLVKWKSAWYLKTHGMRTIHIFREDYIIHNYLNETLDDVTQYLNMVDDVDVFKFIERVKNAMVNWSNYIEKNVDELIEIYNSDFYFGNWNKFAGDKHKSTFFALAKYKIDNSESYKMKKIEYMLKHSYKLNNAKNIIEKYENTNTK